jgi:hypothetical protein
VTLSKALLHLSETPVPPPISALLIAIVCGRDSCSWRGCTALHFFYTPPWKGLLRLQTLILWRMLHASRY